MKQITLGSTGITVPQNAFGALPIQRVSKDDAVPILRRAYEGGMRLFDTARAYTDSEEKLGAAFEGMRHKIYITSKTQAKTPEAFRKDLETTLSAACARTILTYTSFTVQTAALHPMTVRACTRQCLKPKSRARCAI